MTVWSWWRRGSSYTTLMSGCLHHHRSTHRQQILHGDDEAGVSDEPVPQAQDVSDRLHQHTASKQHEVEAGHQVAQAEDADPGGSGDEDETQHKPEEITEHKHFDHIQVAPEDQNEVHRLTLRNRKRREPEKKCPQWNCLTGFEFSFSSYLFTGLIPSNLCGC